MQFSQLQPGARFRFAPSSDGFFNDSFVYVKESARCYTGPDGARHRIGSVSARVVPGVPESFLVAMIGGYLECAAWAESGDPDSPLGEHAPAWHDSARQTARDHCESFAHACLSAGVDLQTIRGMGPEQIGHDLWLTAAGHGAGFWDRGLGSLGDTLTVWAELEQCEACVGDDGLAYLT